MRRHDRSLCLGLALACGAGLAVQAGQFPRWRGADSNGLAGEPGVPPATSWEHVRMGWVSEVRSPHPWNFSNNLCVADGRVIALGGAGLIYCADAATGEKLWRSRKVSGGLVPPLRWVHGGKEYLIVAAGRIDCLDPRTGSVLWSAGALGNDRYNQATPAIDGDYLVAPGAWPKGGQPEGWVCYKLSPTGAEKVWALGAADGYVYFRSAERLVACLDVRAKAASHAQYELTLVDAIGPGLSPRLFLGEREGPFPQSWATCPPRYLCPDPVEADALTREGVTVAGPVKAYLDGIL